MFFAAAVMLHAASAQTVKCGAACNNGITICDPTAECNLCMPHPAGQNQTYACRAGCSNNCTADEHCGSGGCGTCANGVCTASGPPPGHQTCGGACNDGINNCNPNTNCSLCIPKAAKKGSYACGAGCGNACTEHSQCLSAGCNKCRGGACVAEPAPGHQTCGGACNDGVHNCDPKGACSLCIPAQGQEGSFLCGVGCGSACTADSQCLSAGCGKCRGGACVAQPAPPGPPAPAQRCMGACNDGVHTCGVAEECSLCMPHPAAQNKTFACLAGCNRTCASDAHCGSEGCGMCQHGRCAPSSPAPGPVQQCNGACAVNTDCDQTGECNLCVPKTSTTFQCSAACGKGCTDDSHCGVANCMRCVNGTCGRH